MKLATVIAGATALLAPLVAAQRAIVLNNCTFTVYVRSYPYNGGPPGPIATLAPGTNFSEAYRAGGSSLKMGTTANLGKPLLFGYSTGTNPNDAYYELNNEFGNPFVNYYVDLGATRMGCPVFDCAPHSTTCYSTPPGAKKVYHCPRPTSLEATLCAAS